MHHAQSVRRASLSLAVAALFAYPPAAARPGAVRSLLEMRQENVVVQQWDMSCGAAALATILTYQLRDPVPEKKVAQGMLRTTDPMRVKHRGGFSLLDMKRYAESRGYAADGYTELTLRNLLEFAPAIVPVRLEGYDHFVIFRGITAGAAVLADPAFGNRKLPLSEFEAAWSGRIGFVVKHKAESPGTNRMPPRGSDLLAVPAESIRAALDSNVLAPAAEWQLALLPWAGNGSPAGASEVKGNPVQRMPTAVTDNVTAPGIDRSPPAPPGAPAAPELLKAIPAPALVQPAATPGGGTAAASPAGAPLPASASVPISNPVTSLRIPALPTLLGR